MAWTTPINFPATITNATTWPSGWTLLTADQPLRTPTVTRISHPEIHQQTHTPSPNEELHTGTLTDGRHFRFTYQNGYANLGLGAGGAAAVADWRCHHEWGIGGPGENAFASSHERDAVFKGMLNARPDWHTHFAQGGLIPATRAATITAPNGWTDADIVNRGPADPSYGRTHLSVASLPSAEPDGMPHPTPYSINDWNRLVREAQERLNRQHWGEPEPDPIPPAPPRHVPGTDATCECTSCTAHRNLAAASESARRRVNRRAARSSRDPINWTRR